MNVVTVSNTEFQNLVSGQNTNMLGKKYDNGSTIYCGDEFILKNKDTGEYCDECKAYEHYQDLKSTKLHVKQAIVK